MVRTGKASQAVLDRNVRRVIKPAQEIASEFATVCGSVTGRLDPTPEMMAGGLYNKLLAAGQKPFRLIVDLMIPADMHEQVIKQIMQKLTAFVMAHEMTIVCGHTEASAYVAAPILSLTMQGKALMYAQQNEKSAKQGKSSEPGETWDLCMVGYTGAAGSAVLAAAFEEKLLKRFPRIIVDGALSLGEGLAGINDQIFAKEDFPGVLETVHAAYAVSQGGVFGALWEMACAHRWGFSVDLKAIPIRQETIEICEWADLNPYQLYGVGAFLLAVPDGEAFAEKLLEKQIPAAWIGTVNAGNDRIIRNGEEVRYVDKPGQDMLWVAASRSM